MGGNFKDARRRIKPPLERLEHSHRRLEERLDALSSCAQNLAAGRKVEESWAEIEEIAAYLQRAVVRHEEDEEASVFPRLATHPALRTFLARLSDDHASHRKQTGALVELLANRGARDTVLRLQRVVKGLCTSYLDHTAREDRELLPAITRHIPASEQRQMAAEMAQRRDVGPKRGR